MCAAHGKSMVHSGWWDSFAFFYWKNGPRNRRFMVKNGTFGTVLRFFQKIECNYKQFHLITILWLLWLNELLLYKSNALCAMETMLKNAFVGFV